ncbi:MAG: hypothetical protein M1821_009552 [Bathelium mastoideum]|nr:MAG: hypothetical protein M1821_009552 [Bathelium mastoideum]
MPAPQEQRQILRVVNLPVFYCLFNFLALCFYNDYLYIEPIAAIYEAFTVAALFFLVLEWVCPDGTDRERFFDKLEARDKKGNPVPGGSLQWFQRTWSQTLQYPLTKTIITVIQIITQFYGVYCENSFSPKFAHLWLTLIDYLFVGGALGATISFYRRLAPEVDPSHKGKPKFFSFIGIIIFQVLQGLIFHILNGKLFSPTATATYNDINFGVPSFMTCIEAVIFSLIFHWSYSAGEYKESRRHDRLGGYAHRISTFRAVLDAINLSDIVAGTFIAIQLLFMRVKSRYGSSAPPSRQKTMQLEENEMHLEPLSNQGQGGYSDMSHNESSYDAPPYLSPNSNDAIQIPSAPNTARDPSPGARTQTFRADYIRPQLTPEDSTSYDRLPYPREPSPTDGEPIQRQREML